LCSSSHLLMSAASGPGCLRLIRLVDMSQCS
jgi:hypothetical protein